MARSSVAMLTARSVAGWALRLVSQLVSSAVWSVGTRKMVQSIIAMQYVLLRYGKI